MDESKRTGYVLAATTVPDPEATRKVIRGLILPGQQRGLHMKHEQPRRRRVIVSALLTAPVKTTIYDAGRCYATEREARGACLTALVEDLARCRATVRPDSSSNNDSLVGYDNQRTHRGHPSPPGQRDTLHYEHLRSHEDILLATSEIAAWCWVRSGDWRRRIAPILAPLRTV